MLKRFLITSTNRETSIDLPIPLPRLRLERQMGSGEDCLSEASSAAAQMRR